MRTKLQSLATASVAALAMSYIPGTPFAASAFAQTGGDTIVVTGSRIGRKDFVSPSPLVTVDAEMATLSGRPTVDDFLRDLPQFAPGTGDYSNDSNGGTAGRATLNLRNLGAKRNLVIMDGRRLMSSGTDGAIDINTIPSLAIGSIETISGGASATYGSDALSGVVNFKTRTDLNGLEVMGQLLTLDDSGENSYKVGAAYGKNYAGDRGNFLITGEYTDRGGVKYFEREFFNINPQASGFTPYGGTRRLSRGNILSVNNDGTLFNSSNINSPVGGSTYNGDTALPLIVDGAGTLRYHGQIDNFIQVPLEQLTFFGKTDYDIGNGLTAYGKALYASSTAFNEGAPPISAGIWGVTIPFDNFYIQDNPALAALIGTSDILDFQQRFTQTGGRVYNTENDVFQLLGGLKGTIGNRDLNWDIHASYGKTSTLDKTISGSVNFAAVQDIIDSTDATGQSPLCSGGYNPFGGDTPLSADCLDFVSRTPTNETTLEQIVVEGVLEGKLADMPAGESRFALVANYRENTYDFNPDPDIAAGELANLASAAPTTGKIDVAEIAAEVFLPIVSGKENLESFNVTLGARLSDYSPAGTTETFKAEFDARFHDSVMFRGGYQRAVRAPNVEEFFRASLLRVQAFDDVCSSRFRNHVNEAAETALCVEQGADPSYTQGGSSAPTITNGNPDLIPEKADTITFGSVVNFGLGNADVQLSVDYYDIKIEDAIEVLSAQQIFTKCFNLDGVSNPTYDNNYFPCQQITRTNNGFDLDPVNQPILNLGAIDTAGIDIHTSISLPVNAINGRIGLNSYINILDKYEVQAFSDEGFVDFSGTVSTTTANPDLKMLNSLTIDTGPVSIVGTWRHVSAMDDISAAGNAATTIPGAPAYNYFDATSRITIMDNYEIYAGVNNIANKLPPQIGGEAVGSTFSGTNEGVYDGIGRAFFVGAKAKF